MVRTKIDFVPLDKVPYKRRPLNKPYSEPGLFVLKYANGAFNLFTPTSQKTANQLTQIIKRSEAESDIPTRHVENAMKALPLPSSSVLARITGVPYTSTATAPAAVGVKSERVKRERSEEPQGFRHKKEVEDESEDEERGRIHRNDSGQDEEDDEMEEDEELPPQPNSPFTSGLPHHPPPLHSVIPPIIIKPQPIDASTPFLCPAHKAPFTAEEVKHLSQAAEEHSFTNPNTLFELVGYIDNGEKILNEVRAERIQAVNDSIHAATQEDAEKATRLASELNQQEKELTANIAAVRRDRDRLLDAELGKGIHFGLREIVTPRVTGGPLSYVYAPRHDFLGSRYKDNSNLRLMHFMNL